MKIRHLLCAALFVVFALGAARPAYGQAKTPNDETDPCDDQAPPSISCPGSFGVPTDPGVCTAVVTFGTPTASDDCTDSPTVICSPESGSTFEKGDTEVFCTATDGAGRSTVCSFTVSVYDLEPPVFTFCPPSITQQIPPGECSAEVLYSDPEATDNCGTPTITCTPESGSIFPSGKTTVTCTATDEDMNSTSDCSFVVTVDDQVPPTFTSCPGDVTLSTDPGRCDAVSYFGPAAIDNCPGTPTITCEPPVGSFFPKGPTMVTCTATDGAGNSTSDCTFTVTVEDQEPPVINCPGSMTVSTDAGVCNAVVNYPIPTPTDNCPDVGEVTCSPGPGTTFEKGTTTVTCMVTDAAGNSMTCGFSITVRDIEKPSITCPANINQNTDPGLCSAVVSFGSPAASDNCGIASTVCSPPSGSTFLKGTTTVVCTATDTSGNTKSCSFAVIVKDMELPDITCPPNRTKNTDPAKCTAVVTFATPTVTDNCPGVTVTCLPPSGSTFNKGVTTVTCTAKDDSGNMKTCTLTVTVIDKQKPTLACPGDITKNSDPGLCTAVTTFSTPTATDNCPGPISPVTCVPASGSAFITGHTTVICTATDASGNVGFCFFTVAVVDAELPVVTCPGNFGKATDPGLCTAVVTFAATATDNCPDVSPVVCVPASGSTFARGDTAVTCTATDSSGNSGNCSFTVTVSDNEKPSITCPADILLCANAAGSTVASWSPPTAADNCGPPTVTCVPASGSTFTLGATPVTCTATDAAGNTRSCTFQVKVLNVTVVAENGITECMEGRYVTFTATASSQFPHGVDNPIAFTFYFRHADGSAWSATDWSFDLVEDHTAIADSVPDGDADHKFTTPIYVDASNDGVTCTSQIIYIDVYELWIEYFRDDGTGRGWQVVVGRSIAYKAIASSDCTNWKWDMQDGVLDVWNPTGGNARQGTGMIIPNADLPTDNHWDYFGDKYGTVDVFCEDGEGNDHHFYSTAMTPSRKARVYFEKDAATHPGGGTPNWFYYWRKFVTWGRIATLNYNAALGAYASTTPQPRVTQVGPLASQHNNVTGHRGIHTFYETLAHESHHITMWEGWWGVGGAPVPTNDTDSDEYPDSWESTNPAAIAAGFIVGVNDTYNAGPPPSAGFTYEEGQCTQIELGLSYTIYDDKDWSYDPSNANQGKQW